ncbi:MAG: hypothetical protein LAP87_11045 [Acidobacteriia bacterium]|nr:hypothetical protein [Terriglobia bacterium]
MGVKLRRNLLRKIEAGLASARRGELLDGETVMRELRELSAKRRARIKDGK